jgi:hypothetical protein
MSLTQQLAELDADRVQALELFKQFSIASRRASDVLFSLKESQRLYLQNVTLNESTEQIEFEINGRLMKLLSIIEDFDVLIGNYNNLKAICIPKIQNILPEEDP